MVKNGKLTLSVVDGFGQVRCTATGTDDVELRPDQPYAAGDVIVLRSESWPVALQLHYDAALPPATVWLTGDRFDFPVPIGEPHEPYAPEAFCGVPGPLTAKRVALPAGETVNLSENSHDVRGETMCWPHCTASVETRGESVFAARNTIDGGWQNTSHGHWPYGSWGENENVQAEICIDFGRPVTVREMRIQLRADFPHDNWWQTGELIFSDGTREPITFEKTAAPQCFAVAPRCVRWVKLARLKKDPTDPSPFPALRQWAAYGENS